MLTLGIESSCDETAICLIQGHKVIGECVVSSSDLHSKYGGVVPEIASRKHLESLLPALEETLKQSKKKLKNIQLIAATQGPGLIGSLLIGLSSAKALALCTGTPLILVDHVEAHAYAAKLENPSIKFPFMSLVVSGGHTLIFKVMSAQQMKVIGQTIDDAAGEAFDKVGNLLNLPYPGGPTIDKIAQGVDTKAWTFPRPKLKDKDFDFSFSGLKTSVYYQVRDYTKNKKLTKATKAKIASSFQEAACDCLVQKSIRAAKANKINVITVGGGVSANSRLRQRMIESAKAEGMRVYFPAMNYCVDNANMIAGLGQAIAKLQGKKALSKATQSKLFAQEPYPEYPHKTI
ncbi:MAG: N6-L-threonylcarbamoyladenine synthase [Candidatus Omnitrophota bacterium]|jgi:N6-L-threonylcarbamoyladenine synthase